MIIRGRRRASALALLLTLLGSGVVRADQERAADEPERAELEATHDLRARFGLDMAARLAASPDATDRLRAIARALSTAKPDDAAAFIAQFAEPNAPSRSDGLTMMEAARALSSLGAGERANRGLGLVLSQSPPKGERDESAAGENSTENHKRHELARDIAALALARGKDPKALDQLYSALRAGGAPQSAARRALAAYPPEKLPTPAQVQALAGLGERWSDLRLTELLAPLLTGADPAAKAGAMRTLARLRDTRVIPVALKERDAKEARVRAASAYALVVLGAPEAPKAVLALLDDEATVADAIDLAAEAPSDEVILQVAARAARSADHEQRLAAIRSLSRTPSPLAVRALFTLSKMPEVRFEAVHALARARDVSGLTAMEQLLALPGKTDEEQQLRRLGARGYLSRRSLGGAPSDRADAALSAMAQSKDTKDQEVGTLVLVALGLGDLRAALANKSVSIRRGAIMGAQWQGPSARAALLDHVRNEPVEDLRRACLWAMQGDATGPLPITLAYLGDCAEGGNLLCARLFAERADLSMAPRVRALIEAKNHRLRAVVARGLGYANHREDEGTLASTYRKETSAPTRRATLWALAYRGQALTPSTRALLSIAGNVEPDETARGIARSVGTTSAAPAPQDFTWLRAQPSSGQMPNMSGALLIGLGDVAPVLFDDDGIALVPHPLGPTDLLLDPRIP
jgi:hypothetical protein